MRLFNSLFCWLFSISSHVSVKEWVQRGSEIISVTDNLEKYLRSRPEFEFNQHNVKRRGNGFHFLLLSFGTKIV